jgi:hypothetical protein
MVTSFRVKTLIERDNDIDKGNKHLLRKLVEISKGRQVRTFR